MLGADSRGVTGTRFASLAIGALGRFGPNIVRSDDLRHLLGPGPTNFREFA